LTEKEVSTRNATNKIQQTAIHRNNEIVANTTKGEEEGM
jgi:hypothetical protein